MNVFLTESQFKDFINFMAMSDINEGITYSRNGKYINAVVNPVTSKVGNTDAENYGFDSRIFGSKNDILYGDGTANGRVQNFYDRANTRNELVKSYSSAIEYLKSGGKTDLYISDSIESQTKNAILKCIENKDINSLALRLEAYKAEQGVISGKYERISNAEDGKKLERYQIGVVPGTGVKLIALFDITDFNVSDVMKNGYMRQNDTVRNFFNDNELGNETKVFGGATGKEKVPVTYDNGINADVKNNFSMGSENKDHFNRKQYNYSDKEYTSITQFIDKSILYASYVLNKENIHPNFILSAPSSSKYNDYYCSRLSTKLNVPYNNEFFKRNVVNAVFDKNGAKSAGATEKDITLLEYTIRNAALTEIATIISEPIKNFVSQNFKYFNNIRNKKFSRATLTADNISAIISAYVYEFAKKFIMKEGAKSGDLLSMSLLVSTEKELKSKFVDLDSVRQQIDSIVKKYLPNEFSNAVKQTVWNVATYHNKLLNEGYYPKFESKRFKIVTIEKRFRPFVKNAYIIADKELNSQSGELLTRYKNSTFLLFDEDINTGTTLKILIDCLNEKNVNDNQIVCLANAYSPKGR